MKEIEYKVLGVDDLELLVKIGKAFRHMRVSQLLHFLRLYMHRQYLQEIHRQIIIITLIYSGPGGQYFVAAERC